MVVWFVVTALSFFKAELLPPDLQEKWQFIHLIPTISIDVWLAITALLLAISIFEASYLLDRKCTAKLAELNSKIKLLEEGMLSKLELSFDFKEPWFIKLPTSNIPNPATGELINAPSWWVRIKIQNTSQFNVVDGCKAFLKEVEFSIDGQSDYEPTEYGDSLELRWAADEASPFGNHQISYAENRFIDIFSTDPVYNAILVKWNIDLIAHTRLFERQGFYRLTVVARSQNSGIATIKLVVQWTGVWDQVTVRVDRQNKGVSI